MSRDILFNICLSSWKSSVLFKEEKGTVFRDKGMFFGSRVIKLKIYISEHIFCFISTTFTYKKVPTGFHYYIYLLISVCRVLFRWLNDTADQNYIVLKSWTFSVVKHWVLHRQCDRLRNSLTLFVINFECFLSFV